MRWDDLNARARGLSTHLLRRHTLDALSRAGDLDDLARDLSGLGYLPAERVRVPADEIELSVRRAAAGRLGTLYRWLGQRRGVVLAVLLDDEDRRSIRSMVRGAVQHAPPEARMAGLLPTPALPERALEELARQPTPSAVASLLVLWGHPYGAPLLAQTAGPESDLFRIEGELNRAFALRALRGARAGGSTLLAYVRDLIDIENAYTALLLAGDRDAGSGLDVFIAGGRRITTEVFTRAIKDKASAAREITRAFAGTPLAGAFSDPAGAERAVLRAQIAGLRRVVLQRPLTVAPLIEYVLRLRAELMDLRWIAWGLSLGATGPALNAGLVTAR